MPGDPGGLARVDDILGTNMYKTTFTASPLVFGAFPSLHSACAWQIAFFLVFTFGPRAIPFVMAYVFWVWWATMYLSHHYVVDLVGGGVYAVIAFWLGSYFLPTLFHSHGHGQQLQENQRAIKSFTIDMEDLGPTVDRHEKQLLFDAGAHELEMEDQDEEGQGSSQGSGSNSNSRNNSTTSLHQQVSHHSFDEGIEIIDQITQLGAKKDNAKEMATLVVDIPMQSEPLLSPTGSSGSSSQNSTSGRIRASLTSPITTSQTVSRRNSKRRAAVGEKRQSWGGWQGYESWIDVLAAVNSPKTSPRSSPEVSPANSPRNSSTSGNRSSETPFLTHPPQSPVSSVPF
ncbi:Aureobasidin resistance protein Aur1 [Podila humilis]|nr:Aureobasidin resistance protein Aur1 [Podila humilis]